MSYRRLLESVRALTAPLRLMSNVSNVVAAIVCRMLRYILLHTVSSFPREIIDDDEDRRIAYGICKMPKLFLPLDVSLAFASVALRNHA